MAQATARATAEVVTLTVAATSSSMALTKATAVAAAAVASSAASRVAASVATSRAAPAVMATRQAAVPAVRILVLHPQPPTSHLVRHLKAMALIQVHRHKAMARNLVLLRRASAPSPGRTTHRVVTTGSSHMVVSSQVVTVVRRPSTAATAKAATAVSPRVDTHRADTADRHLLGGMAVVDTNSSMATTAMEGDLVSHGLDIDRRA